MANAQTTGVNTDFAYRNRVQGGNGNLLATPANYASVSALRSRLQAISSTTYTNQVLNTMTVNDMVYAVRLNDDPGTI